VVDKTVCDSNPAAYSAFVEPLQLAVEVVSTNWEDDYIDKLDEYQRLIGVGRMSTIYCISRSK
jgi:Uma2 family endonuclease